MKRVAYYMTDQRMATLRAASDRTGLSVSEIIRRALDEYFERHPEPTNPSPAGNPKSVQPSPITNRGPLP